MEVPNWETPLYTCRTRRVFALSARHRSRELEELGPYTSHVKVDVRDHVRDHVQDHTPKAGAQAVVNQIHFGRAGSKSRNEGAIEMINDTI